MNKFNKGDRVRVKSTTSNDYFDINIIPIGSCGIIIDWVVDNQYHIRFDNGIEYSYVPESSLEQIGSPKTKIMNIKEKFVLVITPEPKKSFRKANITDGDDILTEDGTKVFLTWLLHNKYSEEFKKDVVDEILKDEKKKEN